MERKNFIGKCRLCKTPGKLCNSHVFPEFLYKPLYDNKHRFLVLTAKREGKNHFKQKGIYENLLCEKCERHINYYENYVNDVFNGDLITRNQVTYYKNQIIFKGIDYKLFKLFQLSLIWRAGISANDCFKDVKLGPHEEIMRKLIKNNDPGPSYKYGCIMIAFMEKMKDLRNEIIIPPERIRIEGHYSYRFLLGGLFWFFIISSHSNEYSKRFTFIKEDGTLTIGLIAAEETEWIKNLSMRLSRIGSSSETAHAEEKPDIEMPGN